MCIRDRFYIGQTGRSFKLRYKEHAPSSKSNVGRSTFAEHLISYNPVSYTHLDVYKRQIYESYN